MIKSGSGLGTRLRVCPHSPVHSIFRSESDSQRLLVSQATPSVKGVACETKGQPDYASLQRLVAVQFSAFVLLLPVGLFLRYKFTTRSRVMNASARHDRVS